ncbi:MAG: hypothetical protein IPL74_02740 [Bacteroidetes bacterium]|nr:hypothetical protein [Bacteroidota bacterium]
MKTLIQILTVIIILLLQSTNVDAQARLTIENQSMRTMTVKVMKGYGDGGSLHKTVNISAYGSETIYFSESGYYYTKTKAVYVGKEPVYQKGEAFQVTNDRTGYSIMTLTFSITETATPQITGGEEISKQEFDKN